MPSLDPDPARLRAALAAGLPAPLWRLVERVAARASAAGTPLYLVGGAVRDLLLGRPALDLDLVLPGDAVALARQIAAPAAWPVTAHPAFGTATVALPPKMRAGPGGTTTLDFVTARRERYPAPGALPRVEPADLAADLARRDFTINALALTLPPAAPGLIDPHGGRADLASGTIRILHPGSFRDDPTRILRALRYAARFGFTLAPETHAALRAAVHGDDLARLNPGRMRHELERTLAEAAPAPALAMLEAEGVLAAIDPALRWDTAWAADLACAADPYTRLYLLAARAPAEARAGLAGRLDLPARPLTDLTALQDDAEVFAAATPAAAAALLRGREPLALTLARCLGPPALAAVVARYEDTWRHIRPALTGRALQARGVPPGPRYRALLDALRDAWIDGRVSSRAEEQALLDRLLAEAGDAGDAEEQG